MHNATRLYKLFNNQLTSKELKFFFDTADSTDELRVIAVHKKTTKFMLRKLAEHDDDCVKYYVANNENTSASVLRELANNNVISIKVAVAKNSKTPLAVLKLLALDYDFHVRQNAFLNMIDNHLNINVIKYLCIIEREYIKQLLTVNYSKLPIKIRKNKFITLLLLGR